MFAAVCFVMDCTSVVTGKFMNTVEDGLCTNCNPPRPAHKGWEGDLGWSKEKQSDTSFICWKCPHCGTMWRDRQDYADEQAAKVERLDRLAWKLSARTGKSFDDARHELNDRRIVIGLVQLFELFTTPGFFKGKKGL